MLADSPPSAVPIPPSSSSPATELEYNRGIAVGMFYGVLDMVFSTGGMFFSGIFISRTVGVESFGAWSTALLLLNLIVVLVSLRCELTLAQAVGQSRGAENPAAWQTLMTPVLWLIASLSLLASLILVIASLVADQFVDNTTFHTLAILSLSLAPMSITLVLTGIFRGLEQMRWAMIAHSAPFLLWIIIAAALILAGADLIYFSASYVIVFGVVASMLLYRNRHFFAKPAHYSGIFRSRELRLFFWVSLPLALALLVGRVQVQLSNYVVAAWLGNADAAVFNASSALANMLAVILLSVLGIFVPMTARLIASGNLSAARRLYQRITRWLFLPTLATAVPLFVYAPAYLRLYGRGYVSSAEVFRILLVGFVFSVSMGPNRAFLIAIKRNHYILYVNLTIICLNLLFSVLLIPSYGLKGAAVVGGGATILDNLFSSGYLWLKLRVQPFTRRYLWSLVFGLISGVILGWVLPPLLGQTLISSILFGLIYGLLLLVWAWKSHFIDAEDRELASFIVQRFKPS
jgi:stage V sporulation protein B